MGAGIPGVGAVAPGTSPLRGIRVLLRVCVSGRIRLSSGSRTTTADHESVESRGIEALHRPWSFKDADQIRSPGVGTAPCSGNRIGSGTSEEVRGLGRSISDQGRVTRNLDRRSPRIA
jgi:hypothetical protein